MKYLILMFSAFMFVVCGIISLFISVPELHYQATTGVFIFGWLLAVSTVYVVWTNNPTQ